MVKIFDKTILLLYGLLHSIFGLATIISGQNQRWQNRHIFSLSSSSSNKNSFENIFTSF